MFKAGNEKREGTFVESEEEKGAWQRHAGRRRTEGRYRNAGRAS